MPLGEGEETEPCPYDKSHRIIKGRLQFHLIRCQRTNDDPNKKECPYDSTHILDKKELKKHIKNCPARIAQEVQRFKEEFADEDAQVYKIVSAKEPEKKKTPSSPTVVGEANDDEENWENELVTKHYDPIQHCIDNGVVLQPRNMSKAERKKFGEEQSNRILTAKSEAEKKNKKEFSTKKKEKVDASMKPLRRPSSVASQSEAAAFPEPGASTSGLGRGKVPRSKQCAAKFIEASLNRCKL